MKEKTAKTEQLLGLTKKMFAPKIDYLIEICQRQPEVNDNECIILLKRIFSEMCRLSEQGDDEYRRIWISVDRGGIRSFGSYKDYLESGEVENRDEFKELWLIYYPDELKWYSFAVARYQDIGYFYIDSKLTFQFPFNQHECDRAFPQCKSLSEWLLARVLLIVEEINVNADSYNLNVSKNLPHNKRVGRILRRDLWSIFPMEKRHFKNNVTREMLEVINTVQTYSESKPSHFMSKITAGDFFRYCEMGYDANKYFKKSKTAMTPVEKYRAMADGRDCGLMQVAENSVKAFSHWYNKESHCGGHPWEICRGGNSTHISLYVINCEKGWYLRLAGSSRIRVVETVKFAAALFKNNVPFILSDAEEIYRMIKGEDFIGIVPENVTPRYCHSFFPDEDNIIDFMNLGFEESEKIIEKSYWYPMEEVKPIN